MSLASPLFSSGTYVVTREGGVGSIADGDWTPAATGTINIDAGVQPLSGNDLKMLPEGQHAENMMKLYTSTELYTVRGDIGPDLVAINGFSWKVTNVRRYTILSNNFKVLVQRVDLP